MKVMILAAGRGERMRPLTDRTPKPLLEVAGESLIVHSIRRLAAAGITDFVINHAHLGDQIELKLGTGESFGVRIAYSREPEALETAGGIVQALPLLGLDPFLVVNADIWTDFDFAPLVNRHLPHSLLGHLLMVANPPHHPEGDFRVLDGMLNDTDGDRLTYSGIAVFRPELFAGLKPGKQPLAPLLRQEIARGRLSAEVYRGAWFDIGTPERLQQLQQILVARG